MTTKKHTAELLTDLYAAYPSTRFKPAEEEALPRVWLTALTGQDPAAVKRALAEHIRTSRFWPSPAEIIALIREATPTDAAGEDDPPLVRAAIAEGLGAVQARHWLGGSVELERTDDPEVVLIHCPSEFHARWAAANFHLDAIATAAVGSAVRARVAWGSTEARASA